MESNWKVIYYSNTQQTGPAQAIKALAEDLKAKGIEYQMEDFGPFEKSDEAAKVVTKKRRTRKTVERLDLEVRDESNNSSADK